MDNTLTENLTPLELLFCENILAGMRKNKAYEMAGYTPCNKECYKLYAKESVQQYLAKRRLEIVERFKLQQDSVLLELIDLKNRAMENDRLQDELKALDMICKILGLYAPTKTVIKTESSFTDEEIKSLLNNNVQDGQRHES
jgi:hypothetical protein